MTTKTGWAIDDAARLRTLAELGIAGDAVADPALDAIVADAAALCDAPIALITALDTRTQWFMARIGMDASDTPVEQAVCAHALAQGSTLVIDDLARDPRTADNPLVTGDPRIRFYAGVPLVHDGQAIGTLCVIDTVPRDGLADAQLAGLAALAERALARIAAAQS